MKSYLPNAGVLVVFAVPNVPNAEPADPNPVVVPEEAPNKLVPAVEAGFEPNPLNVTVLLEGTVFAPKLNPVDEAGVAAPKVNPDIFQTSTSS